MSEENKPGSTDWAVYNYHLIEIERLRAENERLMVERDEARNTCLHGLDVAGRQNDKLQAENDRLRAVINSHAQSGCMCQFCKDARELAESEKK